MTENANHASRTAGGNAPKEASFGIRHRRGFITAAVVGFLLALVAALGTDQIPFLPRLAYWEILMISGALIGLGVSESVERWGKLRSRPCAEMPFVATLIAAPMTMLVLGASAVFFRASAPSAKAVLFMFGITFAVSMTMTWLNYLMQWPGTGKADPVIEQASAPKQQALEEPANRFSERLPLGMQGVDVLALEAEDHYLRVHLADGRSTLILMRLSDAIAELPAGKGAQTHRSWWVAKAAVQSVAKQDGRATLLLANNVSAPVSRSFYKALNDAGWMT